ncbi:hypothetical protein BBJ28_00008668 [Nothophytophthora sp. Chile5]|nr:hypothetical protein BBJ28_00008668 [Nothophytophthora sp. Chile5]
MIGDPSGKSEERVLLTDETVEHNAQQIIKGLSAVLDFEDPRTGAVIHNNAEWHTQMSAVTWMRDIGRHFRVNAMLQRDSVKKRLETEQGISFLEFSYQLFQAYDFLHLYRHHNCIAQIGGSDQWGNIASGIELVRKSTGDFDFYQYFLRSDDRDVEQLLKSFTFREVEEIRDIVAEHEKAPEKREAQKLLAEDITVMMHGQEGLRTALDATELLFGKKSGPLTAAEMLRMAGDAPVTTLSRGDVIDQSLVDLAVRIGASKSKGKVYPHNADPGPFLSIQRADLVGLLRPLAECRRLIKGGGVYLNNERVESDTLRVEAPMLLDEKMLVLRVGRRNNFIVQVQ